MWQIIYHPATGNFEKISADLSPLNGSFIRIRPDYIGVCGSDKSILAGKRKVYDGLILGHEITGIISEGKGLDLAGDHLSEGDRVVVFPNYYCGECEDCRHGHYNTCRNKISIGVTAQGALQEFFDLNPKFAIRVDEQIDPELAPLIEPMAVAVHAIMKFSDRHKRMIVIGGGSVGISSYVTAKCLGFDDVRIVEKVGIKREELKKHVGDVYQSIDDALGVSTGPINILDTVGSMETINDIEKLSGVIASGSEAVVSGLESQEYSLNQAYFVRREITFRGSIIYTPHDFIIARDVVGREADLLKKTLTLADIHTMIEGLKDRILNSTDIKLILKI
ncbi:alcohol dehydrogenase catalytic domain-containing protein [Thermoplasma sp.]|uniref:zinc-dependent alcohol dehydrogenase n=1 Tax=Thermoplasma sp. TaxID=1973142 RepID=UPI002610680D|nr:alcohol dehydrogenase catalytic domain-containing protein [Thermoplasma sp.]